MKVNLMRERDFNTNDSQGECSTVLTTKTAVIRVLDPLDYSPNAAWPQDMERVLVHELLHLHFAPFEAENGTPEDVLQEQAIDCIATGLVALDRQAPASPPGLKGANEWDTQPNCAKGAQRGRGRKEKPTCM